MLTCQRHLFSIPDDIAYLNNAYMGPLPEVVELAGYQGVARKSLPYEIYAHDFYKPIEEVKKLFAQLINVDDFERIAIVPSVSYGIENAVRNIQPKRGQNIVLVDEIFPSNYYPWRRLANNSGALIHTVKASTGPGRGADWNQKLLETIDNETVVVALPHVHWADGTKFDLAAIRKRTREVGALMIIDGSQSVGALPFDVSEFEPDALVVAGYKWLLGPYSFSLAYYSDYFDNGSPLEENWMNRLNSEDFKNLVNYQPEYKPKAHRYCVGENSHFIAAPMVSAALQYILELGVDNIQNYARNLSQPYFDKLKGMGCQIEDPQFRGGHLTGVRLPGGIDIQRLKEASEAENVFLSFRGNSTRVSANMYNHEGDFEKLMSAFEKTIK